MKIVEKILEYIIGILIVIISILTLVSVTYELDKLQIINILPL